MSEDLSDSAAPSAKKPRRSVITEKTQPLLTYQNVDDDLALLWALKLSLPTFTSENILPGGVFENLTSEQQSLQVAEINAQCEEVERIFQQDLLKFCSENNLGLVPFSVPGDGLCAYHAFMESFSKTFGIELEGGNARQMRSKLVAYARWLLENRYDVFQTETFLLLLVGHGLPEKYRKESKSMKDNILDYLNDHEVCLYASN